MSARRYTFKIGGEAGFGIMAAGLTFSKLATRSGYYTFDYSEYPSIIRGGHNVMQTTFSLDKVRSQLQTTDFLVALNQETIDLHAHELVDGSVVVFDSEKGMSVEQVIAKIHAVDVPFTRIAKEVGETVLMRNTATLGAVMAITGGSLDLLKQMITEEFGDKAGDVVSRNHAVCQAGYDHVKQHYPDGCTQALVPQTEVAEQLVVTANESVALGAIAGGLQFASIYPMTPTSNVLHVLAPWQEKYGFVFKQPEDEISAINMAIGAAFAGARSMVATSGGGFCLMAEGYGLAGITETPVVIIEGMRGGPATGMPTWTEQGDLRFVLHAHQGDFPRIVLAAGDVEEAFHLTMQAFNLADKYQAPVVVLVDKHICESHMSIPPFDYSSYVLDRGRLMMSPDQSKDGFVEFERYALTEDGISPRPVPGLGFHFVANSDEHNTVGYSDEGGQNRIDQMEKRMKKMLVCEQQDMADPVLYGPEDAKVTLVSWGSNKGAILDALEELPEVNYLHITWMNPFPTEQVKAVLAKAHYVMNLEANYSAQLGGLIAEKTGIRILDNFLKYDCRPFFPEEIVERVRSVMK